MATVVGMKRSRDDDVVHLNVGGVYYDTRRSTLCSHEGPLQHMFNQTGNFSGQVSTDRDGRSFIDRNGRAFACVLDFLRTGTATVPSGLSLAECQRELNYFFVQPPMVRNEALLALNKRPSLMAFLQVFIVRVGNVIRAGNGPQWIRFGNHRLHVRIQKHSSLLHELRCFICDTASGGQSSSDHWTTNEDFRLAVGEMHAEPLDERSLEFYLETFDTDIRWSVRYEGRSLDNQLGLMRARFVHFTALYSGPVNKPTKQ